MRERHRDSDRETETERQTERQRDRQRNRDIETERGAGKCHYDVVYSKVSVVYN